MTLLVNSAEGGTSTTTVTAANSGGASGSAFDVVTIGASATLTFDGTHPAHGSLAYDFTTGASAVSSLLQWSTSMGSQPQAWFRLYCYFTANPAANVNLWRAQQGATLCGGLRLLTTGKLTMIDSAGTQQITTTNTIPLNTLFRIEGFVLGSATAGQLEVKLFSSSPDAITADETQTSVATLNTTGSMDTYRYGVTAAQANVAAFWLDDLGLSSAGYIGPVVPPAAAGQVLPGQAWLRRFHHRQVQPPPVSVIAAVVSGSPVYPLGHPVQARALPQRGGSTISRAGVFAQAGPPVKPPQGPAGVPGHSLPPRGRAISRAGAFAGAGAPVTPPRGPVQAKMPLARSLGRSQSRAGTFTAAAPQAGPPVYPLGHPVQARRLPLQGGRVVRRAGTFAGTGTAVRPPQGPVSAARRPLPSRGRVAALRGPYGQAGPPVAPQRKPVRAQPQRPLLTGRAASRAGAFTAPSVPSFTVGALTASTAPGAVLGAADAGVSALTASTAPSGALTARDQRTGGPG